MDKIELLIMGIVSIAALIAMLYYGAMTGNAALEAYNMGLKFNAPSTQYPALNSIELAPMFYTKEQLPTREMLVPKALGFMVDSITIPENNYYHFISLKQGKIHTFSGIAGYYNQDPTFFIQAQLCSYAYKIPSSPLFCELAPLSYSNNKISFANGYKPNYYIGNQAAGTDFAALFVLANADYGILAASPIAYLRWVDD